MIQVNEGEISMDQEIKCPRCGSTSIIGHVVMVDMEEKKIYRCLACGEEFSIEGM
jgi:DNA-directed RNA polymerase subunit RPC12/RpoP